MALNRRFLGGSCVLVIEIEGDQREPVSNVWLFFLPGIGGTMSAEQATEIIKILHSIDQTGYIVILILGGILGSNMSKK